MRTVKFEIKGQQIECLETISDLVGNTKNYLQAEFSFSEEWEGLIQIAVFCSNSKNYPVVLENGVCKVPDEVMRTEYFTVGCYAGAGTERITSNTCKIRVDESVRVEKGIDYIGVLEELKRVNEEEIEKIEDYIKQRGGVCFQKFEELLEYYGMEKKIYAKTEEFLAKLPSKLLLFAFYQSAHDDYYIDDVPIEYGCFLYVGTGNYTYMLKCNTRNDLEGPYEYKKSKWELCNNKENSVSEIGIETGVWTPKFYLGPSGLTEPISYEASENTYVKIGNVFILQGFFELGEHKVNELQDRLLGLEGYKAAGHYTLNVWDYNQYNIGTYTTYKDSAQFGGRGSIDEDSEVTRMYISGVVVCEEL